MFKNYIREEAGASAAEYALILALISAGLAIAAGLLGTAIEGAIGNATTEITSV